MMKLKKHLLTFSAMLAALLLGGCDYALLDPKGAIGLDIRNTTFITTAAMLAIVVPTILFTIWVVWKFRKKQGSIYDSDWEHSTKIELFAWGVPLLVVAFLATVTFFATHRLDPRKPIKSDKEPLTVQVVSLDWKWLFIYPEEGIASVNELAVPVDRPVEFLITSNSTMNSFFIPRLGGQLYAMAGMENRLNLIANEVGVYRGISSNYSGYGFTGMQFDVKAVEETKFNEWVASVKASPKQLNAETFETLAKASRNHPVEFFGKIDALQFKNIIEKFSGVQ